MKFAIVTPSYNQGPFIERTLRSVLSQDEIELEYVVFDGGSTDQTIQILQAHSVEHGDRMRWISEADKGQAHAVNKGLKSTTGEIIGWLNSDDIYYPGTLKTVADFLAAHPDVDVVYGAAHHIDANDQHIDRYPTEPWSFPRMQETCIICQPAAFFRRRVIDQYGLLDEQLNYCMDYEFWLRIGAAGARFQLLDKVLAASRMYAQNKTLGSRLAVHAEINTMFKERFGQVPDRWIHNYAHIAAEQRIDQNIYPRWFVFELVWRVLAASVRWNRNISREIRTDIRHWIRGVIRLT